MAGFAPRRTIIEPVDIFIDEPEEEWYEGLQHFYNSEGFGVRDRFGNELIRERGLEDIF